VIRVSGSEKKPFKAESIAPQPAQACVLVVIDELAAA